MGWGQKSSQLKVRISPGVRRNSAIRSPMEKLHFMKHKKEKLYHKRWVLFFWGYFAVLLTIFILAYLRMIPVKIAKIPFYDTLGHFLLLGLTSYFAHRALGRRMINLFNFAIPLGPFLVGIFAVAEESIQVISPYRTFSFIDMAANLSGIIFFYWLVETWFI